MFHQHETNENAIILEAWCGKPICDLLKKATSELDHDAISISIVPKQVVASDGEKQNLDQLEPSFMYTVLFKEIVLEIDEDDSKAMKQLVDHCRKTASTDQHELREDTTRNRLYGNIRVKVFFTAW